MKKHLIVTLCLVIIASSLSFGQETFTDSRDGKTYKIKEIGIKMEGGVIVPRTWLAENLNYKMKGSYCYKNEPAYCEAFGSLYSWEAALEACPNGWHLATKLEWEEVFGTYGGMEVAGSALKPKGESGLDVKMSGWGDPGNKWFDVGNSANYWDAESRTETAAGLISIESNEDQVFHFQVGNDHRNSVRCVKDY